MNKIADKVTKAVVDTNAWKKFTSVSVGRGITAWPRDSKTQQNLGIRFDYDGEIEQDNEVYNKFQMQPNSGKIPSAVDKWRKDNGGTHGVMASLLVKKNGSVDDVEESVKAAFEEVKK